METAEHTSEHTPEWIVALVQLIARWLGADQGRARLEFELTDGRLTRTFRHTGPIGHTELAALAEANAN